MNHRLTKQRKLILDVVRFACYHPTAEQIYILVKKQLSSISIGTVYRNLDILVSQSLIKRIDIPGEVVRFDADLSDKAYFVCSKMGVIYDLPIEKSKLVKILPQNTIIDSSDSFSLVIFGKSKKGSDEIMMRKGKLNISHF